MPAQSIFERDEVFADLNRRATQAKDEGRIAEAVELLQQAKVRQGEAYEELRLALYLQAAGRVDEALAEIDWLIARAAEQVARKASYLTAEAQCHASTLQLSRIHDKARLICQRAGRLDQAAHHSQLHEELERRLPALGRSADRAEKAAAKKRKSLIQKEIQAQIRIMRATHLKGKP